jgi:hypothetical protein
VTLAGWPRGGVTVARSAATVTGVPALAAVSTITVGAPPGRASASLGVSTGTGTPGSSQRIVSPHTLAVASQPLAHAAAAPGVHAATRPRPYCHCASTGY